MARKHVSLLLVFAIELISCGLRVAQESTVNSPVPVTASNASELKCVNVHNINKSMQCSFVKTTDDCQIQGGYIDYIRLPYCYLNGSVAGAVVLYLLWITFLFINVALTVKSFLYPCLDAISKILRLSESVAGVTFLALGNGAADIFSLIVLMSKEDNDGSFAETAMGGILGGGLFVTSVVVGLICFNYELKVKPVPFLRDVLFYVAAVTWLLVMIIDGKIVVGEAIGFICLYVLYVTFVLLSLRWDRTSRSSEETHPLIGGDGDDRVESRETAIDGETSERDQFSETSHTGKSEEILIKETDSLESNGRTMRDDTKYQCWQLLRALWPYSLDEFLLSKWYLKAILVLQMPLRLLLTLTVPVVDYSVDSRSSWNRLLIFFNIILGPAVTALAFDFFLQEVGTAYLMVGLIVFAASLVVALLVAFTSYTYHPPRYYWAFSFLGFLMSIVWIYIITSEVVNVLEAASITLQLSRALVGLLVLAFGNSVCDLVANFVVARQGKAIMGFSACYGSPLLNMLIGVALGFLIATATHKGTYVVKLTAQLGVAAGFLICGLLVALIFVTLRRWKADRLLGVILPIAYIAFVFALLCVEFIP